MERQTYEMHGKACPRKGSEKGGQIHRVKAGSTREMYSQNLRKYWCGNNSVEILAWKYWCLFHMECIYCCDVAPTTLPLPQLT